MERPHTLEKYNLVKIVDIPAMTAHELNYVKDCVIARKAELAKIKRPLTEYQKFVRDFKTVPGENRIKSAAAAWKKIAPRDLMVLENSHVTKIKVRPTDNVEDLFPGATVTNEGYHLTGPIGDFEIVTVERNIKTVVFNNKTHQINDTVSNTLKVPEEDLIVMETDIGYEAGIRYFDVDVHNADSKVRVFSARPSWLVKKVLPVHGTFTQVFLGDVEIDPNKTFAECGVSGLNNVKLTLR